MAEAASETSSPSPSCASAVSRDDYTYRAHHASGRRDRRNHASAGVILSDFQSARDAEVKGGAGARAGVAVKACAVASRHDGAEKNRNAYEAAENHRGGEVNSSAEVASRHGDARGEESHGVLVAAKSTYAYAAATHREHGVEASPSGAWAADCRHGV